MIRKNQDAFKPSKLERARGTQRYAQFSLDLLKKVCLEGVGDFKPGPPIQ
jgi:hypothetical protein